MEPVKDSSVAVGEDLACPKFSYVAQVDDNEIGLYVQGKEHSPALRGQSQDLLKVPIKCNSAIILN